VAYHLLAQAGTARAPWPITTVVSCLPLLLLGMRTALAHMLRAGAEAMDAPEVTGLPTLSWPAEDQDRPDRRRPVAERDRSAERDHNVSASGPQHDGETTEHGSL
jgi:hypothetical protein